ncbi:siderophore-interacting protein [Chromobacterium vaccinii]|uniref:siderophore-interacting protein n=1 Tax=Chromobacterium vaccinii TaxID=1108595 RepID=UPI000E166DBB|nr:siderophore-interacting protein [Chromobacterium vaccinii]SUX55228.1 NADPH-dependent ferric-chelate reductase [Chromobacterium vaccinii]
MNTELEIQRLRHPLRFRLLQVARVSRLSPSMLRITLAGDDLDGFVSASFDDHVKLFFPEPGAEQPALPAIAEDGGIRFPAGKPKPPMRDYTPRRYDAAAGELDIDFVVHAGGIAADWALSAKPGDKLGIGGPRGSRVIPSGFDWHWLLGDESALPAIARRLEELPDDARGLALILADSPDCRFELAAPAGVEVVWRYRSRSESLEQALDGRDLPSGAGFVWAAGESGEMRPIHQQLKQLGLSKDRMRVAGYWKRGDAGSHESISEE